MLLWTIHQTGLIREVNTEETVAFCFTDEKIDIAKNTDHLDLLKHLGYHLKQIGRYYTI